jgi:hypothetical protein
VSRRRRPEAFVLKERLASALTLGAALFRRQLVEAERPHNNMGLVHKPAARVASLSPLKDDFRHQRLRQRADPCTTHFTRTRNPMPSDTIYAGLRQHRHELRYFKCRCYFFVILPLWTVGAEHE